MASPLMSVPAPTPLHYLMWCDGISHTHNSLHRRWPLPWWVYRHRLLDIIWCDVMGYLTLITAYIGDGLSLDECTGTDSSTLVDVMWWDISRLIKPLWRRWTSSWKLWLHQLLSTLVDWFDRKPPNHNIPHGGDRHSLNDCTYTYFFA